MKGKPPEHPKGGGRRPASAAKGRARPAGPAGEVERLRAELAAARRTIKELKARADRDPLLPLLNRRGFVRALKRAIAYARRYGAVASLVYLDLDGFKAVNDTYGHAAGDRVLVAIARLLIDNVRRSDVLGRVGGDEFAILLWNAAGAAAEAKAAALARLIAEAPLDGVEGIEGIDGSLGLAASWGVTALSGEDTAETALARADEAMYAGKKAARRR